MLKAKCLFVISACFSKLTEISSNWEDRNSVYQKVNKEIQNYKNFVSLKVQKMPSYSILMYDFVLQVLEKLMKKTDANM